MASAAALLLMALTLCLYAPVRQHEFVAYDDDLYITTNAHVLDGLSWAGAKWAFTTTHAGNWHPLTWLSHMVDTELFGSSAAGAHAVNGFLHAVNAALLFILLRHLTGTFWRSLAVAALFAAHPLRVESVAWAAERKDVLSGAFFLLTLLAYAAYVPSTARGSERRTTATGAWYVAGLGCFACALLSKPTVVTLPCVLLLLDLWPLRRLTTNPTDGDPVCSWGRLLAEKMPFFALSALGCGSTYVAERQHGAMTTLATLSIFERASNALVSYARYLGKTVWPSELAVYYPHPLHWPTVQIVGSALVLVGITVLAVLLRRRGSYFAVGWGWFVGMLIPAIGLVQVGGQAMADRYTYLPSIGLLIAMVWTAAGLAHGFPRARGALVAIAAADVAVCGAITRHQLQFWRNSAALFEHALAVTEANDLAHDGLGNALLDRGDVRGAIAHFERAIAINPRFGAAHYNLGLAWARSGELERAIACFASAFALEPKNARAANSLADALMNVGRIADAIRAYEAVLALQPELAVVHHNLGLALWKSGCAGEAVRHFRQAVDLEPTNAIAWNNLGWMLRINGQGQAAAEACRRALALRPDLVAAQTNLSKALEVAGDNPTATMQLDATPPTHQSAGVQRE